MGCRFANIASLLRPTRNSQHELGQRIILIIYSFLTLAVFVQQQLWCPPSLTDDCFCRCTWMCSFISVLLDWSRFFAPQNYALVQIKKQDTAFLLLIDVASAFIFEMIAPKYPILWIVSYMHRISFRLFSLSFVAPISQDNRLSGPTKEHASRFHTMTLADLHFSIVCFYVKMFSWSWCRPLYCPFLINFSVFPPLQDANIEICLHVINLHILLSLSQNLPTIPSYPITILSSAPLMVFILFIILDITGAIFN